MVNPEQFLYGDRSGFRKGGRMYIHIFSGWWQIFLNAPAAFCEKKQTAAEIDIPTAA